MLVIDRELYDRIVLRDFRGELPDIEITLCDTRQSRAKIGVAADERWVIKREPPVRWEAKDVP